MRNEEKEVREESHRLLENHRLLETQAERIGATLQQELLLVLEKKVLVASLQHRVQNQKANDELLRFPLIF